MSHTNHVLKRDFAYLIRFYVRLLLVQIDL